MDRPILIELDWVRAKKPIGRWIDHIELFVGHGDPARQHELRSSLEKCGVCIDHFCQSHPIMYLQHFHAIVESFILHQMQKCSHWIPTDHQDSAVLGGFGVRGKGPVGWNGSGGGVPQPSRKVFRALPLCKERRPSRVKDFDSTHLPKLIHFVGMAMPMEF